MFTVTQRDPMLDVLHQLEHRMGRTFNGELLRASEWPVPESATTAWLPLVDIFEEPDVILSGRGPTIERWARVSGTQSSSERSAPWSLGLGLLTCIGQLIHVADNVT